MSMQATTTAPLFSARLTPHRSLSRRGVWMVVALAGALALIPGFVFVAMGAWPVIGFMGLDVLAVAWAMHASFKGGKRSEQVTLWKDRLELVSTGAKGVATSKSFDPRSVRLVIERDFNEHTTGLLLRAGGVDTPVGSFLHPDDLSSFGKALGSALRRARA
jgi:uncharacterized membrane protein